MKSFHDLYSISPEMVTNIEVAMSMAYYRGQAVAFRLVVLPEEFVDIAQELSIWHYDLGWGDYIEEECCHDQPNCDDDYIDECIRRKVNELLDDLSKVVPPVKVPENTVRASPTRGAFVKRGDKIPWLFVPPHKLRPGDEFWPTRPIYNAATIDVQDSSELILFPSPFWRITPQDVEVIVRFYERIYRVPEVRIEVNRN